MKRQDLSLCCTGSIETEINFGPLMWIMKVPCISMALAFHRRTMVQDSHIVIQSKEGRVAKIIAKWGEKENPYSF